MTQVGAVAVSQPPTSTQSSAAQSSSNSSSSQSLGSLNSSEFLQLLVTQLTHQDPTNPMDPTQMISETSTLTMVQDIQSLSSTVTQMQSGLQQMQAQSLMSQNVDYTDANGNPATGVVSGVTYGSNGPTLTIGTNQIPLSSVTGVSS